MHTYYKKDEKGCIETHISFLCKVANKVSEYPAVPDIVDEESVLNFSGNTKKVTWDIGNINNSNDDRTSDRNPNLETPNEPTCGEMGRESLLVKDAMKRHSYRPWKNGRLAWTIDYMPWIRKKRYSKKSRSRSESVEQLGHSLDFVTYFEQTERFNRMERTDLTLSRGGGVEFVRQLLPRLNRKVMVPSKHAGMPLESATGNMSEKNHNEDFKIC